MSLRRTSFLRCMCVCAPILCALLMFPVRAAAASSDMLELESYTLTMEKVTTLAKTLSDISACTKAHPDVRAKLETEGDGTETLDAVAARMNGIPEIAAILTQNRIQPREFLLTELTFMQTVAAVANKPIDQGDTEYAAKVHLNPANLAFMRDHQAQLQALQAHLGTAS